MCCPVGAGVAAGACRGWGQRGWSRGAGGPWGTARPNGLGQPELLGARHLQAQGLLRPQLHQHLASTIAQAQAAAGRGPQGEHRGFPQQDPHLGAPQGHPIGLGRRRIEGGPGPGQAHQQAADQQADAQLAPLQGRHGQHRLKPQGPTSETRPGTRDRVSL